MVPMAYRLAHQRTVPGASAGGGESEEAEVEVEEKKSGILRPSADEEDEQRDGAFRRLETLGYRVGQGLAER